MLQIHEINTFEKFSELRKSWNKVLRRSRDDSPFLTWEHIAVSINNLKDEQKLKILYITDENKILAIAPLRQSCNYLRNRFRYIVLEPLDYGAATDYTGLILTEKPNDCMSFFLEYLYSQNNWDFFCINDIPKESAVVQILNEHKDLFPKFKIETGATCPFIKLPDSIEEFQNLLSSNYKRNVARRLRKLKREHGVVEIKEYFEVGSLEQSMNLFFELHQKRWISKGEKGTFNLQEMRNLFLDRARFFAEKGWLGLYFLTVKEKPIAAKYCLKYNEKLYGCLSGFDPDFSSYSVGKTLLIEVIKKAIDQGFKEYDFMKGDEAYKFRLTGNFRKNVNLKFVNNRFGSQLFRLGSLIKDALGMPRVSAKMNRIRKVQ